MVPGPPGTFKSRAAWLNWIGFLARAVAGGFIKVKYLYSTYLVFVLCNQYAVSLDSRYYF